MNTKRLFIVPVAALLLFQPFSFAQYENTGSQGMYFSKKEYTDSPIPLFKEKRQFLPSPILEDNPEYIELYWKTWELAFRHYKKPPTGSPFVSNYLDEAFAPNIFQWDTFFMIMFARYAHHIFPAVQSLDNFYRMQYENGYICREIVEATGEDFVFEGRDNTVNPPLFSWSEVESYKVTGDKSRFESVLPAIVKYTEWLENYRKKEGTKHGLYWQTGLGSGMDNTPRSGSAWTDMSAQMVMCYNDIAFMYEETGRKEEGAKYRQKAKGIADKINTMMWNEEDGLYYDLDDEGNQVKCKTVACFWPMLAGISTSAQAEKMIMNLKDPNSFWRHIPFPSLSADHKAYQPDGKYWLGSTWAPTNVMIIKGINRHADVQGSQEFAVASVEKYLDGMCKVYKKTGTIWENYSPDSDMRGIWSRPDFVGWSGCGPIQLLIEDVLGFMPNGANNKLVWALHRIDRHGIQDLKFGNTTATLIAQKRESVNSPCIFSVNSSNEFELTILKPDGKTEIFKVQKGQNSFEIK